MTEWLGYISKYPPLILSTLPISQLCLWRLCRPCALCKQIRPCSILLLCIGIFAPPTSVNRYPLYNLHIQVSSFRNCSQAGQGISCRHLGHVLCAACWSGKTSRTRRRQDIQCSLSWSLAESSNFSSSIKLSSTLSPGLVLIVNALSPAPLGLNL